LQSLFPSFADSADCSARKLLRAIDETGKLLQIESIQRTKKAREEKQEEK
jgi:hypothetical protein